MLISYENQVNIRPWVYPAYRLSTGWIGIFGWPIQAQARRLPPSSLYHEYRVWLWAYPWAWISPLLGRLFWLAHQSPGPSTTASDTSRFFVEHPRSVSD